MKFITSYLAIGKRLKKLISNAKNENDFDQTSNEYFDNEIKKLHNKLNNDHVIEMESLTNQLEEERELELNTMKLVYFHLPFYIFTPLLQEI